MALTRFQPTATPISLEMEMCPPLQVLPLTLLLVSGLYLFVLPYATKRRSGPRTDSNCRLTSCAFGDYQRDVVGLFMRAESSSLICNCYQQLRHG